MKNAVLELSSYMDAFVDGPNDETGYSRRKSSHDFARAAATLRGGCTDDDGDRLGTASSDAGTEATEEFEEEFPDHKFGRKTNADDIRHLTELVSEELHRTSVQQPLSPGAKEAASQKLDVPLRAACRYTQEGTPDFVGIRLVGLPRAREPELEGTERTEVSLLLEHVDEVAAALRSQNEQLLVAFGADFPSLFRDLGANLTLYVRSFLSNSGGSIDGVNVALLAMVRCVELLDGLLAAEGVKSPWDVGLSPAAVALGRDAVVEALAGVSGQRGITAACIECFSAQPNGARDDQSSAAVHEELRIHSAMALHLLLQWRPPGDHLRVSVAESFLAVGGYEAVLKVMLLAGVPTSAALHAPGRFCDTHGYVALLMDMLRITLACDAGARRLLKLLHVPRMKGAAESDVPLAVFAMQCLVAAPDLALKAETNAACDAPLRAASEATVAAAIHLVAIVLSLPSAAAQATCEPKEEVARRIKAALHGRPLTIRLARAVYAVVSAAPHRRSWRMSMPGTTQERSLHRCLIDAEIASECVQSLMLALGPFASMSTESDDESFETTAARIGEWASYVSLLCRHVEAIVADLHGSSDLKRLLQNTAKNCGASDADSDGTLPKPSLMLGLAHLRRGIRKSCLLPFKR